MTQKDCRIGIEQAAMEIRACLGTPPFPLQSPMTLGLRETCKHGMDHLEAPLAPSLTTITVTSASTTE